MSMSSGCGARRLPDGKSSVCSWAFSYSIFFVVFRRGPVGCPPASRNSDRFLPRSTDRQRNSHDFDPDEGRPEQIGRASCRERVCQYVLISVVAVSLKQKKKKRKKQ